LNDSVSGSRNDADATILRSPSRGALRLLVVSEGLMRSIAVPQAGEVSIGRAQDCDLVLDDSQVSRRHARLIVGEKLELEDLGSANGTRVARRELAARECVEVGPGDVLTFGNTVVLLQVTSSNTRPRRVWTHGYFEARVEDECARAEAGGKAFCVGRVFVVRAAGEQAVEGTFGRCLRPTDVLAMYAPGEYEVLLVDTDAENANLIGDQMHALAKAADIELAIGIAAYPRAGRTPEALVSASGRAARGLRSPPRLLDGIEASATMQRLRPVLSRVAAGNISVLITGETGVGKEVFARAVHELSTRASQRLVTVNCAALTESLLESELFGYERGAFTGAVQAKAGLIESADRGTVFLDEIGEMPLAVQAKLLRVLEQRQVLRLGSLNPRAIDVRFIAATNRDLDAHVARGAFREDLYFRVNGFSLCIPPLRERVDEIEPLALAFVARYAQELGVNAAPISAEAMDLLRRYAWPGNVRELRNMIERAVLLSRGSPIELHHLAADKMMRTLRTSPGSGAPLAPPPPSATRPAHGLERPSTPTLTREQLVMALEQCAGNQSQAARLLGVSRKRLIANIEEHALPRPRKR
jgi:two-component system, NtrC family, response regulator AtoC